MTDWTDETITRLRQLWAEGLSAAEIGRRLRTTRNAVTGKARRLNLDGRPSPIPPPKPGRNSRVTPWSLERDAYLREHYPRRTGGTCGYCDGAVVALNALPGPIPVLTGKSVMWHARNVLHLRRLGAVTNAAKARGACNRRRRPSPAVRPACAPIPRPVGSGRQTPPPGTGLPPPRPDVEATAASATAEASSSPGGVRALRPRPCCWPIGGEGRAMRMCDAPVLLRQGDGCLVATSYCAEHTARAYVRRCKPAVEEAL